MSCCLISLAVIAGACGVHQKNSGEALYQKAERTQRQGQLQEALKQTRRGLDECRDQDVNSELCWKFRLLEGELRLSFPPQKEAVEGLEKARIKCPPKPELQARLLTLLGYNKFLLGQTEQSRVEARKLLEQAYQLASRVGSSQAIQVVETTYGILLDDLPSAEKMLSHACKVAEQLGDGYLWSRALNNLGYVLMDHSRFDDAIPPFQSAARVAEKSGSRQMRELALGNLAWCYYKLGDLDRALDLFSQAQSLSTEIGDTDRLQRWVGDTGDIHFVRGEFRDAMSSFRQAASLAERVGNYRWLSLWQSNLAASALEIGDLDSAEQLNNEALALERTHPDLSFEVWPIWNRAAIAERRREFAQAETLYHQAITLAIKQEKSQELWGAQAGLASVYRKTGRAKAAESQYRTTLASIGKEWSNLAEDDLKLTFFEALNFYQDYVDLLVERGRKDTALEVADSSRARLLSLRVGGATPVGLRVEELRRAARATHTVFLAYWLAPVRSFLWVIGPKGIELFQLPPAREIEALVERHNRRIQNMEDLVGEFPEDAEALYRVLVGPAGRLISPGSKVLIVPDGRLNDLNFETLVVEKPRPPRYWIEDVTIAVAPSLGLLRSEQAKRRGRPKLLFIGDPLTPAGIVPPLPHLKEEVSLVTRVFPASSETIITREHAYPGAYGESMPINYSLIHFAAHAIARPERPLYSEIVLSEKKGAYKLYARDILREPLQAELVTISGCHSAGSKTYTGEGLVGFTWAFLRAGARNVIAGLWDIDDGTAPEVMSSLYAHFLARESPPDALRFTKLDLLKSRRVNHRPYYWAPWVVFTRSIPKS